MVDNILNSMNERDKSLKEAIVQDIVDIKLGKNEELFKEMKQNIIS